MVSESKRKKAYPFAILSTLCMLVIDFGGIFDIPGPIIVFVCPIIGIVSNIIVIDLLRSYKNIHVFSIIQIVCYSVIFSYFLYYYDYDSPVPLLLSMLVGMIASIRVLQLIDL